MFFSKDTMNIIHNYMLMKLILKSFYFTLTGDRLVNVNVTYSIKGVVEICGFYPGLLSRDGDVIMFFCPPEARASSVKLQIQSKSGQVDYLMLCEVEIYRKK